MNQKELLNRLSSIFCKVFNNIKLEITIDTSPMDIDNWDSLNHVVLITEVEKEFNIKFSLDELLSIDNVGSLLITIEKKIVN